MRRILTRLRARAAQRWQDTRIAFRQPAGAIVTVFRRDAESRPADASSTDVRLAGDAQRTTAAPRDARIPADAWLSMDVDRPGDPPRSEDAERSGDAERAGNAAFTEDADTSADARRSAFDGGRAFALLGAQCDVGPRIPGTAGHARTRDLLTEELSRWADEVAVQEWTQRIDRGPGKGTAPAMANIFARFHGTASAEGSAPAGRDAAPELMLCAHWDTRPVADHDRDPSKRADPVPGASDGASGVAVLLELARVLRMHPPARTVTLALFDGEDLGEYYYGSRFYARSAHASANARWKPRRAILLDMIGGHPLRCTTEINSLNAAPGLWNEVHAAATRLGLDAHFHGHARAITDDHVFLNRAGIPSVVLIDYSYPHWHTTEDTVDKCGRQPLQVIGDVLLDFIRAALPPAGAS
jgi:hypothetical protein